MTQSAQFSKGYYVFLIVFLGMLSAFGPFVTDMYLPTLPSMAEIFHTTPSLVQNHQPHALPTRPARLRLNNPAVTAAPSAI